MTETITVVGRVASDPSRTVVGDGLTIASFRLASTHRRFDSESKTWVDAGTNWFTVSAYRRLAEHAHQSLSRGDGVIVTGRLKIRDWESGGRRGTSVDLDADTIGHDLRWGTASFQRAPRASRSGQEDVPEAAPEVAESSSWDAAGAVAEETPF